MYTDLNSIPLTTKLFYLISVSDGKIDEKEMLMSEQMISHERLDSEKFERDLQQLINTNEPGLLDDCLSQLSKLDKSVQINTLAWMCLVANSDGFMDKNEWQLIYQIYHKNLRLNLDEILTRQKELNHIIKLSHARVGLFDDSKDRKHQLTMPFPL